jgi:hypothetical protein
VSGCAHQSSSRKSSHSGLASFASASRVRTCTLSSHYAVRRTDLQVLSQADACTLRCTVCCVESVPLCPCPPKRQSQRIRTACFAVLQTWHTRTRHSCHIADSHGGDEMGRALLERVNADGRIYIVHTVWACMPVGSAPYNGLSLNTAVVDCYLDSCCLRVEFRNFHIVFRARVRLLSVTTGT